MCGIVGYAGERSCRELLLNGLERLEYRGYDSAGLSLILDGEIESVRAVGNLGRLRAAGDANGHGNGNGNGRDGSDDGDVATLVEESTTGIGHTRWATH